MKRREGDGPAENDALPPIILYYYIDLADTEFFCERLRERFSGSGHQRPVEFRPWNCYNDTPPRDGDIYCYDAMVLSALVDGGYIRRLPEIIDTDGVFPWILERSRVRNAVYGFPFMSCASVLICREEDDLGARNIFDLPEGTAAPLKSMVMNYYLYALCCLQNRKKEISRTLRQIKRIVGQEAFENSRFSVYDGIERFRRGECRYLLGFTEDLRRLEPGRYAVRPLVFSDQRVNEMPLYPTDFASVGKNVSGEKLLDCLDLLEIISGREFIYELCTARGELQYMLPADRSLYPELARLDPLYASFLRMMDCEDNGVLRYGKNFYTDYARKEQELIRRLERVADE